ncbi:MAG TPA: AAC(3) family N-acetyltransferase [Candidatus Goldiibacteriota bacterium]|nr:AAC(3) family N-acetyltransferase [Candidatus Goldiibacteriota bacterium]
MELTKNDFIKAIKTSGLSGKCVCVHSSIQSFMTDIKGGINTIIQSFIESGCTLLVPTFSFYAFTVKPPKNMRPERNGIDYNKIEFLNFENKNFFTKTCNEIDRDKMGLLPCEVLKNNKRERGEHPLCSFSALGPFAKDLIKGQKYMDVFAPLRELALFEGYVVLIGVDLNRMTLLHLAEQMAGRRMFLRWANDSSGNPVYAEAGGCSEGFVNMTPYLSVFEKQIFVGKSKWRIYSVPKVLKQAAKVITSMPEITRCADNECVRCEDAIKGGPKI